MPKGKGKKGNWNSHCYHQVTYLMIKVMGRGNNGCGNHRSHGCFHDANVYHLSVLMHQKFINHQYDEWENN